MDELVAAEPRVHYGQVRPMVTAKIRDEAALRRALARPAGITLDCSEIATLLCRLAGLADPNGRGYDGSGYTGTMLEHLPHYDDPRRANIGALVVLGPGTGEHVCMVRTPGPDPILFSHGWEGGPALIRFSAERAYHRPPATFLAISGLG